MTVVGPLVALQFGAIRQIRLGNAQDTRGTAFVVYEDIYDAKNAVDHLSGFNVCGRYLVVLYYQQTKMQKRLDTEREMKELAEMRARLGIDGGDEGAEDKAREQAHRVAQPQLPRTIGDHTHHRRREERPCEREESDDADIAARRWHVQVEAGLENDCEGEIRSSNL